MNDHNKSAILCGKEITFTDEERAAIGKYHCSRLAFAFKNDKPLINLHDDRDHRTYLREDFGIDDDEFETLIRGYIKPGKIVFYITSHHSEVEMVPLDYINATKLLAWENYGAGKYSIYNGVKVGEPGIEWPHIKTIGSTNIFNTVEYFDAIFATEFMSPKQIVLVKARNLYSNEHVVYIGTSDGNDEQKDIERVLKHGAKWPIELLQNFIK